MRNTNYCLKGHCHGRACAKFFNRNLKNYIRYILNWPLPLGAFQGQWNTITTEQNIQQQLLRITTGGRRASWLFTRAAEKLNQGLPGTNSTSGQDVSWTFLPVVFSIILPVKCGSMLLIGTSKKGRTWSVCFPLHCKVYIRALFANVILKKGSIFLRMEKTKCVIHIAAT